MKKEKQKGKIVFCSGEKVILRPLMKGDIEKLLVWFNNPEMTQYLSMNMPMYEKEEEEWLEMLHKRKQTDIVFAIETKKGNFIGTIGLHKIIWVDRIAEVGIAIGEKEYRGRGYGTEALMLLLEYAFNSLNLRKACLTVLGFNKRAYRCYCKCGFKVEGRKRQQFYKNGRYTDEIVMAVFKRNWLTSKKR